MQGGKQPLFYAAFFFRIRQAYQAVLFFCCSCGASLFIIIHSHQKSKASDTKDLPQIINFEIILFCFF